jgi:hypothetical protein
MTLKRVLHCALVFMVLVTSGCSWLTPDKPGATPNATSSPTPQPGNMIDFVGATSDVQKALDRLHPPGRPAPPVSVKSIKEPIDSAIEKLGTEESRLRELCTDCTDKTKDDAVRALNSLSEMKRQLRSDSKNLDDELKTSLEKALKLEVDALKQLSSAKPKPSEAPSVTTTVSPETPKIETDDSGLWGLLVLLAKIFGALLILVLLASAVHYLWKRLWRTLESRIARVVKAQLIAAFEGQPDYSPKFSALASTQTDTNNKLGEVDNEVRSLARLVRDSLARRSDRNPSYGGSNYQSYSEDASPKDEPEFPVSAVDYLGKMNRFANVVRPDFQNGILVNAPDGDGELVLIRDSRDETQPLFVVPRATQFHTKQDFYTYYQKYYDCVRPSAGDVWIIGPAVVEKVTGGWQLREKGMLEIR